MPTLPDEMGQAKKFSLLYYSGSPHAPAYYSYRLTGTFEHARALRILYEETRGQQTSHWSATLQDQEYVRWLEALGRASLGPLERAGGGYQLSLTSEAGQTREGEPSNWTELAELARRLESRHGPEAGRRRALMKWMLAGASYVGFQLLLVLIWLVCFLAGIGGLWIHLLLLIALVLALAGAVAGLFVMLPRRERR